MSIFSYDGENSSMGKGIEVGLLGATFSFLGCRIGGVDEQ